MKKQNQEHKFGKGVGGLFVLPFGIVSVRRGLMFEGLNRQPPVGRPKN